MAIDEKDDGADGVVQEGMARRVAGKVRRVAGALGRAARGASGRPEAGTDVLFQKLHADHEEVNQLFEKLLAVGEGHRAQELWAELSVKLAAHARAEQQTVYEALSRQDETREEVPHAFTEHAEIEDLMLQLNAMQPGTPAFQERLPELERTVRHHVDDEEGELLPRARQALSDEELEQIVARFETRKFELMPLIERELSGPQAREEQQDKPAAKASGKSSGKQASKAKGGAKASAKKASGLEERTYDELMELARKREIRGRSKMKKQELLEALQASE
jgi:hemerythrin superfamily protein